MHRLDHEKLEVYQSSLALIGWLEPFLRRLPKGLAVFDQLDRASTSIPLNIAEGNGKFTKPDRCRYFDHARGSALECAAASMFWSQKDMSLSRKSNLEKTAFGASFRCWSD